MHLRTFVYSWLEAWAEGGVTGEVHESCMRDAASANARQVVIFSCVGTHLSFFFPYLQVWRTSDTLRALVFSISERFSGGDRAQNK
jgi:hypothetical protein